jgi:hypothetical protein
MSCFGGCSASSNPERRAGWMPSLSKFHQSDVGRSSSGRTWFNHDPIVKTEFGQIQSGKNAEAHEVCIGLFIKQTQLLQM